MSIKNTGSQTINGWTLTWTWSGNQYIIQSWNSNYTQSGQNVALANASWNGTIPSGTTLTGIGFNANYGGTQYKPDRVLCQRNPVSVNSAKAHLFTKNGWVFL